MTERSEELRRFADEIKHQRDELRVKLHLARADVRDEWDALEKRWDHLRGRLRVLGEEAGHTGGEVGAALRLAAEELKAGYARLRALV